APVEGVVDGVILDVRADAEKKIPRQFVWDREIASHCGSESGVDALAAPAKSIGGFFRGVGARNALRPEAERAVGPDMDFAHFADGAGLNVFDGQARIVEILALIVHLGC